MANAEAVDPGGACAFLLEEQGGVEERFRRLEDARGSGARRAAGEAVLDAVEAVLALEEQLLCPAVRRALGEGRGTARVLAAGRTARSVVAELRSLPPGERRDARFALLKDLLAGHAQERAGLFAAVAGSPLDLERLGGDMREFKARLEQARAPGLLRRLFPR